MSSTCLICSIDTFGASERKNYLELVAISTKNNWATENVVLTEDQLGINSSCTGIIEILIEYEKVVKIISNTVGNM